MAAAAKKKLAVIIDASEGEREFFGARQLAALVPQQIAARLQARSRPNQLVAEEERAGQRMRLELRLKPILMERRRWAVEANAL